MDRPPHRQAPVIVLGSGSHITTLAVARCFRGTGIPVLVVDGDDEAAFLSASRDIDGVIAVPALARDPNRYCEQLSDLGAALRREWNRRVVLFPTDDSTLRLCADAFARLADSYQLPGDPDETAFTAMCGKWECLSLLARLGFDVIPTRLAATRASLREAGDLAFPVVAKPAVKGKGREFEQRFGAKVVLARSEGELHSTFADFFPPGGMLLQTYVEHREGDEVSWCGYRGRSGEAFRATSRALRRHPAIGGTATAVRTEDVSEVGRLGDEIVRALDFRGICEIEFLPADARGGYRVVECNPRPWLQIGLLHRSGLNLPLIAYRDSAREPLPSDGIRAREGAYWVSPEYHLLRCLSAHDGRRWYRRSADWVREVARASDRAGWDAREPWLAVRRLISYARRLRGYVAGADPATRRRFALARGLASAAVLSVALYYVVRTFAGAASQFGRYHFDLQWSRVGVAVALYLASTLYLPWIWQLLFARFRVTVSYRDAMHICYVSYLGRYVPGRVVSAAMQIGIAGRLKIDTPVAFTVVGLYNVITMLVGIEVFAISSLIWPATHLLPALAWPGLVVAIVGLHTAVVERQVVGAVSLVGGQNVGMDARARWRIGVHVLLLLSWLTFAGGVYAMINAITPIGPADAWTITGIQAISSLVGFLGVIVPAGIGIREAAQVFLLKGLFPLALVAAVPLALRAWLTVGDVIVFALGLASAPRRRGALTRRRGA